LGGVELVLGRTLGAGFLRTLRNQGRNQRRLLIVGTGALAQHVIRQVKSNESAGWRCCRAVALEKNGDPPEKLMGVPVMSRLDRLAALVQRGSIDEVWICLPLSEYEAIKEVRYWLRHSTVTQRLVPDLSTIRLVRHQVDEILDMPVLNLTDSPMRGFNRVLKALEDRVLAGFILLLISPFMLFIALGVKLTSKGPVFYRQRRVGWDGSAFSMLKFRSMPVNTESQTGPVWARQSEQRATRFGTLLRRTSLDELPQFINVLKGDMSIVGPRPERPVFVEQFKHKIPGYMQKHLVKAGITGWAQVNGWRGNTDLRKRIEHDLYYIEHWSLWLDFKIIALTALHGFVHANAY
jgi:putative colanic acid biosynthesis UDP-glucose lipid carrier transferase